MRITFLRLNYWIEDLKKNSTSASRDIPKTQSGDVLCSLAPNRSCYWTDPSQQGSRRRNALLFDSQCCRRNTRAMISPPSDDFDTKEQVYLQQISRQVTADIHAQSIVHVSLRSELSHASIDEGNAGFACQCRKRQKGIQRLTSAKT